MPVPIPERLPVLVVEDAPEDQLLYEKYLRGSEFQAIPARSLDEARHALARVRPRAIVLDILLGAQDSWGFLAAAKADPVLHGDSRSSSPRRSRIERRGWRWAPTRTPSKPVARPGSCESFASVTIGQTARRRVLVIDDDEIVRYVLRQQLYRHEIVEAADGEEGLAEARRMRRRTSSCWTSVMPGMSGHRRARRARRRRRTREVPVVRLTADPAGRARAKGSGRSPPAAVVSKDALAGRDQDNGLTQTLARLGLA